MEIKIVIDDRLVLGARRLVTRRRLVVAAAMTVLGSALAWAAPLSSVPHAFSDGDVVSAAKMNENFQAVVDALGEVEAASSTWTSNSGSEVYTERNGYCGKTADNLDGSQGGWLKIKDWCEAICSSPGAHMCTTAEINRAAQLGDFVPVGRVAALQVAIEIPYAGTGTANAALNCAGWTVNASDAFSLRWKDGLLGALPCSLPAAFLCCD